MSSDDGWAPCTIKWLTPGQGGRSQPPTGPVYSPTAIFEDFVQRDLWGCGPDDHTSVQLAIDAQPEAGSWGPAKIRILVPGADKGQLAPGRRFWLMEGARRVALGKVVQQL